MAKAECETMGEGAFIILYEQVSSLAHRILREDNLTCGKNWPAGQEWDQLAGSSKDIFMRRARKALLIDNDAFLSVLRNWPYSDRAMERTEELYGK